MAQPQGFSLANVNARHTLRHDVLNLRKHLVFAGIFEGLLKAGVRVEMILDGAFGAASNKNQLGSAGVDSLFYRILNKWFVHNRQHFLWASLGGWQEARATAGHRKNGCSDFVTQCVTPRLYLVRIIAN